MDRSFYGLILFLTLPDVSGIIK